LQRCGLFRLHHVFLYLCLSLTAALDHLNILAWHPLWMWGRQPEADQFTRRMSSDCVTHLLTNNILIKRLDSRVSKEVKLRLRQRHCYQARGGQATQLFIYPFARWRF